MPEHFPCCQSRAKLDIDYSKIINHFTVGTAKFLNGFKMQFVKNVERKNELAKKFRHIF